MNIFLNDGCISVQDNIICAFFLKKYFFMAYLGHSVGGVAHAIFLWPKRCSWIVLLWLFGGAIVPSWCKHRSAELARSISSRVWIIIAGKTCCFDRGHWYFDAFFLRELVVIKVEIRVWLILFLSGISNRLLLGCPPSISITLVWIVKNVAIKFIWRKIGLMIFRTLIVLFLSWQLFPLIRQTAALTTLTEEICFEVAWWFVVDSQDLITLSLNATCIGRWTLSKLKWISIVERILGHLSHNWPIALGWFKLGSTEHFKLAGKMSFVWLLVSCLLLLFLYLMPDGWLWSLSS